MTAPGSWPSPLSAEAATAAVRQVRQVQYGPDGAVWWEELRPDEGGRSVLVREGAGVQVPDGFDARTAFHEYGGRCWLPVAGGVVTSSMTDQRLWLLPEDGEPRPLSPDTGGRDRWCLPQQVPGGLLCLRERLLDDTARGARNELVLVADDGAVTVLWGASDFVDAPRLSPDGRQLAFVTWDHPRMPWDGTELRVAPYDGGPLGAAQVVLGGPAESVFQPEWDDTGLRAVSDAGGWWNLVRLPGGAPVWQVDEECGWPAWTPGYASHATLTGGRLAVVHGRAEQRLSVLGRGGRRELDLPFTTWAPVLAVRGDRLLGVAATSTTAPAVVEVDTRAGSWREVAGSPPPDPAWAPVPAQVEVPSAGRSTYARLYPPTSPEQELTGPAPWLLRVHGGPTAHTRAQYDSTTAFWTSRGFGVVDVDHAGSTGQGRAYRELLRGQWGVAEVDDCEAVARWLLGSGRAGTVVITGGSAGGWTVLSALTRGGSVFAAGTSYYGVADLAAFAAGTHDFESRYLDGLVPREQWAERSPLAHVDRLDRPLLVLQGTEDKVVPPEQATLLLEALAARGVPHAALELPGEGHGFRRRESQVAALEAELAFYGQVLGFATPGIAPVELLGR